MSGVLESSRAGHVLVSTRSSRDNCRLAEWRTTGAKPALIAAGNVRHLGYEDIANVGTGLGGSASYDGLPVSRRPHLRVRGVDELLAMLTERGDRNDAGGGVQ